MNYRVLAIIILLNMLVLSLTSVLPAYASSGYEVYPSIDINNFIVYQTKERTNITNTTLTTMVFPPTFRIQYSAEYDKVVNGWWCWQWWNPECDPANYRYKVLKKEYHYRNTNLPQVIEINNTRILLTYFTSVSAVPYATKTWWGQLEEHVKVVLNVYIYGRIDRPPTEPTKIDLGNIISSIIGSDRIILDFSIKVHRTDPNPAVYTATGSFDLLLRGLDLTFYKLRVRNMWTYVTGGQAIGSYDKEGYIMIAPVGSITVDMCLDGERGYNLKGKLQYYNMYKIFETDVSLDSGSCASFTIDNAILSPGKYTGNESLTVTFKTGLFSINLEGEAEVDGALFSASIPYVVLEPRETDNGEYEWYATIYVGVNYQSYNFYSPGTIKVDGTIYVKGTPISITCQEEQFTSPGTYECTQSLGRLPYSVADVTDASAKLTVEISLLGVTHSGTVTVDCAIISPSTVHGIIISFYYYLSQLALAFIIGGVMFYLFSHISALGLGRYIIDPHQAMRLLLFSAVFAVFIFGIPYVFWFVLKIVYMFPEFSSVLQQSPISNPDQILSLKPHEAISMLFNYYDMTLNAIKTDYRIWVETELQVNLAARILAIGVGLGILFGLALLLMITANSPVAGSVMIPLASFALSIIGMLIMLLPGIGVVNALIAITEFILVATAVIFLSVIAIGAVLAFIPSGTLTRYAEDLLGAGLLYIIGVPAFAPIIYAIYKYVMKQIEFYIIEVEKSLMGIKIFLGPLQLFIVPPVGTFMRVTSFMAMASLTCLMIILLHAYLLTRSGLMGAIGEGLMRITRR